jgi:hypothetical protein
MRAQRPLGPRMRSALRSWIPMDGSEAALLGVVVLTALLLAAIFAIDP